MTSIDCVKGSNLNIVDLGVASVKISKTPQFLVDAGVEMLNTQTKYGYPHVLGVESIREEVAQNLLKSEGVLFPITNIGLMCGARAATNAVIEYILNRFPGCTVLGPQLAWPEYDMQSIRYGGKYRRVQGPESNFYGPLADDFAREFVPEARLLVICNPGNPVGNTYTSLQLRDILSFARQSNLYVLVDETYQDIIFSPAGHQSSFRAILHDPSFLEWARTHVSLARTLGKTYQCPGARGGTLVAPVEIVQHQAMLMTERSHAVPLVTQAMIGAAARWSDSEKQAYFSELRAIIQENIRQVYQWAKPHSEFLKPYTSNIPPASPLVFLDVSKLLQRTGLEITDLVKQLELRGLKVVSGTASGDSKGLRLAIGHPTATVLQGFEIFQKFIH